MSVRVRLTRVGSKKNPIWRVVVADQRSPRDGRVIEQIGRYNPQTQPSEVVLDTERLEHWLARGAQPTDTVRRLIKIQERTAAGIEPPKAATAGPKKKKAAPPPEAAVEAAPEAEEPPAEEPAPEEPAAEEPAEEPAAEEPAPEGDAPAEDAPAEDAPAEES
jgi:small subunit ribosomal protein S16